MNKLLVLLFCMIMLVGSVNALDFDNWGSYDEEQRTMNIKNAFRLGETLADITLLSELNVQVIPGKDKKVAEMRFSNFDNTYDNALKKMDFYDIKKGMKKFERDFVYKYKKKIGEEEVPNYVSNCEINATGHETCGQKQEGTKIKEIYEWTEFKKIKDLPKGDITVGIFTDVYEGDYVEWIPTFFGVEIDEWASWTSSLNENLAVYYKLDNNNTAEEEVRGVNTGVATGDPKNVSGIIKTGVYLYGGDYYTIQEPNFDPETNNFTISVWMNVTPSANTRGIYSKTNSVSHGFDFFWSGSVAGDPIGFTHWDGGSGTTYNSLASGIGGSSPLTHVVVTYNHTHLCFWINGTNYGCNAETGDIPAYNNDVTIGARDKANVPQDAFRGVIDELGIWNRSLTIDEISDLYNDGNGLTYQGLGIIQNAPVDNFANNSADVTFNCSATNLGGTVSNVSLHIDNVLNYTQAGAGTFTELFQNIENIADGSHTWRCEASAGREIVVSDNRTFTLDATVPSVTVHNPKPLINYGVINFSLILNWTVVEDNIDSIWFDYNETSTSLVGLINETSFNIESYLNNNLTFSANDTSGNINETLVEWNYKVFENSREFNATSFVGNNEGFLINLTTNGSLNDVILYYNETGYTATNASDVWSTNFTISDVGTNPFFWSFTYEGENFNISSENQTVSTSVFELCGGTANVTYLNLTFADEDDLSALNASIPASTFYYWTTSQDINQTYTFSETEENASYAFCYEPSDVGINLIYDIQYESTNYQQRIVSEQLALTNTTTNKTLYLLHDDDGLFVTLQVINSAEQVLEGVNIEIMRQIGGVDTVVGSGTTNAAGISTFWLDPDFSHTFTFTKTGFTTYTTSFAPTQTSYTITLGGGDEVLSHDYTRGIGTTIFPTSQELFNDTTYSFQFNVTSSYWDLDSFGFTLRLLNGTTVGGETSVVAGTPATFSYNVNNQSMVYMDYYWIIEGNTTGGSRYWIVTNTQYTGWSIKTFFTDLNLYMDSGLFGIDDFGRMLLVFLILFISVGIISYKYGGTSPMAIVSMIFAIVFFLDIVVGLVPPIRGIENVLTYLSGLILAVIIIREVSR